MTEINEHAAASLLFALHRHMRASSDQTSANIYYVGYTAPIVLPNGRTIKIDWERWSRRHFIMVGEDWECMPWNDQGRFVIRHFAGNKETFAQDLLEIKLLVP